MKIENFLVILSLFLANNLFSQQYQILEKSENKFIYVLKSENKISQIKELSGLVKVDNLIFAVDDNLSSYFKIENDFSIKSHYPLSNSFYNLEGVDYNTNNNNFIFLTEEDSLINSIKTNINKIFTYSPDNKIVKQLSEIKFNDCKNAGFEGIAFNTNKNIIYLAKERDGNKGTDTYLTRGIWICKYDNDSLQVVDTILTFRDYPCITDFTDIKYVKDGENEYLYILERLRSNIIKYDLVKDTVSEIQTFEPYDISTKGKIFQGKNDNRYGKAEALLITEKEIWVGFDGNAEPFVEEWFTQWQSSFVNETTTSGNTNSIVMKFKKF